MILREYLYVDTTIVRGLLAQLDSGVVESEATVDSLTKATSGGAKGFVEHAQEWGDSRTTTKAMGDALFPVLEEALESEGMLTDVSDVVADDTSWESGDLSHVLPPGRIVRVTAPGYLFDARFIATVLSGFTSTQRGLVNMGTLPQPEDIVLPPKAKKNGKSKQYKELPGEIDDLEGRIPLGAIRFDDSGDSQMSGEFLRGLTQVSRGMFAPGLHLVLAPEASNSGAINVRLQEGRQYLDTDPDILFARYGVGAQEWSVVGTVGHYPEVDPDMGDADFIDDDQNVRRAEFARYVNRLGSVLGNLGFTDLPQAPGFSVIPWAVYRTIGTPEGSAA